MDSGSEKQPFKSLNTALKTVADGGSVNIIGSYNLNSGFVWNQNGKSVTVCGGELDTTELNEFCVGSDVTFRNIKIILKDGQKINPGNNNVIFEDTAEIIYGATLVYTDEFLFGNQPTFYWNGLRTGESVSLSLTDIYGNSVLEVNGITTDSYTCSISLTDGEYYILNAEYTKADGTKKQMGNIKRGGKKLRCITGNSTDDAENYKIDGSVSLDVLNNYLDRAVTYCVCLGNATMYDGKSIDEAIRFITNVGAKYVQRAAGEWYPSYDSEQYYDAVKAKLAAAHAVDPDIIFEACIFETSGVSMNDIPIPEWVFNAFGQKVQKRCFNSANTVFRNGYGVNNWENGYHIPDITRIETQMFIYYRACSFIDLGFEALHLGQVELTGKNDTDYAVYTKLIQMIRDYAKKNARRKYVLINAHSSSFVGSDKKMLSDMIVLPSRVHAAEGEVNHEASENNPQRCDIEPGYWDSVYQSGISGTSPSGWYTEKYPYLVEFDNYGGVLGDTSDKNSYVWGKDEITWYAAQPDWYRRYFMEYIKNKIAGYNENGHIALVGFRGGEFFANNKSSLCENGRGDENTIKTILSSK